MPGRFAVIRLLLSMTLGACAPRAATNVPPEYTISPTVTIGGAEDGAASFSDIRAIAVDDWGRVFVSDVTEREIRLFDSSGHFVRRFGRRGQGPGEFNRPVGLALNAGGDLFVYDPVQWRVSAFDTAGALRHTYLVPFASWGPFWEGGLDRTGRMVDRQTSRSHQDTVTRWDIRRLDLATGREERLPFTTCGFREPVVFVDGGVVAVPYGAGRLTWIDPDRGSWCATTARPVAYFIPLGATAPTDSVVSVVTPARVTAAEHDSAAIRLERNGQMVGASARILDSLVIPATKPPLQALGMDERGRLWMQLLDDRGTVFHVFDSTGRWLARVRTTVLASWWLRPVVKGNNLYLISKDSMDVPVIHRLPVPGALTR